MIRRETNCEISLELFVFCPSFSGFFFFCFFHLPSKAFLRFVIYIPSDTWQMGRLFCRSIFLSVYYSYLKSNRLCGRNPHTCPSHRPPNLSNKLPPLSRPLTTRHSHSRHTVIVAIPWIIPDSVITSGLGLNPVTPKQ